MNSTEDSAAPLPDSPDPAVARENATEAVVAQDGSVGSTGDHNAAGVDPDAGEADDTSLNVVDTPGKNGKGRPRKCITLSDRSLRGTNGLCIVQWNQKDLSYDERNERSQVRVDNILMELTDTNRYGKALPAVCVMQEIVGRAAGGGEMALRKITTGMNERVRTERNLAPLYHYKLSGVMNPMSASKAEQYAVVYNKQMMGECIVDEVFRENLSSFAQADDNEGFLIGNARINLRRARDVFERVANNGGILNDRFDRIPALFSFSGPEGPENRFPDGKKLHIIAAHSSTGKANSSPHQNMVESIFMQEICHQAAEQGEYCILLGDFNHDERDNLTQFMWDTDGELYAIDDVENNSGVDERDFSETRERFLSNYVRACSVRSPTNVFPFLAGGDATGKHNDDIWIPKVQGQPLFLSNNPTSTYNPEVFGTADSRVLFRVDLGRNTERRQLGDVLTVPERILKKWDEAVRDFYLQREIEGRYQPRLNSGARQRMNAMLAKVWSDHRPLKVTLKLNSDSNAPKTPSKDDDFDSNAPKIPPKDDDSDSNAPKSPPEDKTQKIEGLLQKMTLDSNAPKSPPEDKTQKIEGLLQKMTLDASSQEMNALHLSSSSSQEMNALHLSSSS